MSAKDNLQPFSGRSNGNQPQPLPQVYAPQPIASDDEKLDLAWLFAVLRRRSGVMLGVAIALSLISGSLLVWNSKRIVPSYQGNFKLLVEPVTAEGRLAKLSLLAQADNSTNVNDISSLSGSNSDLVDYETQIRVLNSPKLMTPVIKKLQAKYPDISYNSLMAKLKITRETYEKDAKQEGTKLLNVSYEDKDPEKIKFVLEELSHAYLDYSLDERLSSLRQGITFINNQINPLQQRVNSFQGELQQLRQQYNLTNPELTGEDLSNQSQNLAQQQVEIQTKLAQARTLYATLQKQFAQASTTSLLGRESNTYQTLLSRLQTVESDIAVQSAKFREDSPQIQSLREQQGNLRSLLSQEAEAILENAAGQIRELQAQSQVIAQNQKAINQKLAQFPLVLRKYADLQRNLGVASDSLKLSLEKRETLKLDAAQRETPWEVIAPPDIARNADGVPIPSGTANTSRQLAVAIILSLLLGFGVGFLIEILHRVFHTPEEVKAATKLPLLGVIPFDKNLKKLIGVRQTEVLSADSMMLGSGGTISLDNAAEYLEALRSLYTNIRLLSGETPIRSLAISSAVPGEGKSTLAAYLAQTAAAIGQRVLLVDADLRRPQIHERLGLPNVRGLSDAIIGSVSLDDLIVRSPIEENLFVLTTGPLPADPIKLLSSNKMSYLMGQVQAAFDLVIYDTPPLIGLADGNLIAAHTNGIILVVGLEKTDRSMLTKALDELKISGASILGVVANGIEGYTPTPYASYRRTASV